MTLAALFDDYIYARISDDDLRLEKNVQRQLRNSRAKSAAHSGKVVFEDSDNDISASKGAHRPGFQRLMAAITAPNPDRRQRRIVCQHTSRLWRNRSERAHGIDTLGKAKVIVLPIDGPQLDLTTAAGRMVAGMLGEVDTGESETKSERIVDAARERAHEGRAHAKCPYGWKRMYIYDSRGKVVSYEDIVDEAEAAVVREIVARLLTGEPVRAITRDLNERGIKAPGTGYRLKRRGLEQAEDGSRWGRTSVERLAVRPANIGLRPFHRGQDDEELLPGAFPAIIDIASHNSVVALLAPSPDRIRRPSARRYLLTRGIGECGQCGSFLECSNRQGGRRVLYVCSLQHCVGRSMAKVDEYVTAVMVQLLSRDDAVMLLDGSSSASSEAFVRARELRARLNKAAGDYAEGLLEAEQLRVITSRLRPEIESAEALAASAQAHPFAAMAASLVGGKARQRWAALEVAQRRAVLEAFGVRVFIDRVPAGLRGKALFDPSTVRVLPGSAG